MNIFITNIDIIYNEWVVDDKVLNREVEEYKVKFKLNNYIDCSMIIDADECGLDIEQIKEYIKRKVRGCDKIE